MKPLKKNVLVERTNKESVQNGIILTDTQVTQNEGIVVAAGPDADEVKEGDLVVFVAAKTETTIDGRKLLVMSIDDIVAVKEVN